MAITKIKAIKTTPGKAIAYIENPEKTEYGQLVSGYNCSPESAELEFALTAQMANQAKKTESKPQTSNLAYHLIQSFSPNDAVTPEQAHELGKQLADRFLEGEHEYVISTHVDKGHIHNHIIINATSWLTGKKLRTKPYRTASQLRAISDQICISNELSTIRQPAGLSYSYQEWQQRRDHNSWKAELRKRLNFILSRATSYDQFLAMCKELGVAVNDEGKHIKYRLRDLEQQRWTRGNKLADTEHFTLSGVRDQIAENANVAKLIRVGIMGEISQSENWEDFSERLEANHGIRISQGKLGLIYHLPDGLRKKEAELGTAFSKKQLLRALSDPEYIPGDEPEISIREEWEAAERKQLKETEITPIKLKEEDIVRISLDGLLVKIPDQEDETNVFIDNKHVDYDSDTQRYTIYLTSEYYYYAMPDEINPDLPESEQLGSKEIRGETMIRAFDRKNGAEYHWVNVPAEYIRSMKPDLLTLTFQRDGVTNVRFRDPQDMEISPSGCKIKIYDNWTYAQSFRGAEMREILEQSERPAVDQMWRKYRAYRRGSQHQRAQTLAKVLRIMDQEGISGLKDFSVQAASLSAQIEARRSHIQLLQQKRSQYAMAHRYLETVQIYEPIHEQVTQAKGWAKEKLEKTHQAELNLYDTAVENLKAMNVRITVEPEKVAGMMDNLADEIRRYQAEIENLDKRKEELERTESIVREILGQEEENQREDRQQQQDQRQKTTRGTFTR